MHFTKAKNATQNWTSLPSEEVQSNGICDNLTHKYQFARIPYITKHKVNLCLGCKFLPKKNIVKNYNFFQVFF